MSGSTEHPNVKAVRISGIVAILAAVANGVGDVFYQGVADGAYSVDMEFMWRVPEPNLRFGAYIGLFAIALLPAGYWHVYQGIKKAGRWLSFPPFLIAMYSVPIGCVLHFGLFYPALVGHQIMKTSGEAEQILTVLHGVMINTNSVLYMIYTLCVTVFSLWLMVLIFTGRTSYPRWFGVLNPLFLTVVWVLLVPLIPTYGAYLYPAAALSDAVFFAFSTKLLWNIDT